MSTRNEQLADLIRLACLTEHRTDAEQRALLAWAWDCDKAHNKNTVSNRARNSEGWALQNLVYLAHTTRVLEDDNKLVGPPKQWNKTWKVWESELAQIGVGESANTAAHAHGTEG